MAFVVCALIMYMLWWHKPFGVDRRTVLTASMYEDNTRLWGLVSVYRDTHRPDLTRKELTEIYFGLEKFTTGKLFSAFHIGAWNWEFPSPIVRTLWRTFALAATGTGPAAIFLLSFYIVILEPKFPGDYAGAAIAILLLLLALIYIISRLALMVLIFYCFSSMPAGVYETVDWTKFLPHFS